MHDGHFDVTKRGLELSGDLASAHLREDFPNALDSLLYRLLIDRLPPIILQKVVNHLVEGYRLPVYRQPISEALQAGPKDVLRLLPISPVPALQSITHAKGPEATPVVRLLLLLVEQSARSGERRLRTASEANLAPADGAVFAAILNELDRAVLVEVVAAGREPPRRDHLLLADGAVVELVD